MTYPISTLFPKFRGVPHEILKIMKSVEETTGQTCFLSGGAVRDLLFQREIKDLDLVLSYNVEAVSNILDDFDPLGGLVYQNVGVTVAEYTGFEDVTSVIGIRAIPYDLNFIFLKPEAFGSLHKVVARNDFGICQVGCDSDGYVACTDHFVMDAVTCTFTLLRSGEAQRERSLKRWERLKEKYPAFELSTPAL